MSISPLWQEIPGAILIVRSSPRPAVGVLARLDARDRARLAAYAEELNVALPHLRYVGYTQVQEDCERLGEQLIERFGRDELRRFRFVAIPRGGFIVLGVLAYVLGLEHTQLESPSSPDVPLIVVDDCALTGSRFGRFLARCKSPRVVFAHLYSHPELRVAIEACEDAVIACLGARDLQDHAPERFSSGYAAWRKRWKSHAGSHHYWIGQPDHLCFPWNEPDRAVWDPVAERAERGWSVVPPELCLKNRPAPSTEPIPIQMQPKGRGPLRPSSHVLFGEFEGCIVVGNIETEESFGLTGVAADMWTAIVERGNVAEAVVCLSKEYDVSPAVLEADLRNFVENLLAHNLLEDIDAPTHTR